MSTVPRTRGPRQDLTSEHLYFVLSQIATHASILSQLAIDAAAEADDDDNGSAMRFRGLAALADSVGVLADGALGWEHESGPLAWLCGPMLHEVKA